MQQAPEAEKPVNRAGWPVNEWSFESGISRSSTYELIAENRIESVKFGQRRIITTPPREFLNSLKGAA